MSGYGVAVVTGAAGALGSHIAAQLHSDGYTVVGLDRVAQPQPTVGLTTNPFALWVVADQSNRASVDEAYARVDAKLGVPSVVVANAGYAKFGGWLEMDPRTFERHVAVNVTGTFHVVQAGAQLMARTRSGGAITIVSSSLALAHADQVGAYCVTKNTLLSLTRSMAAELGVHRIRVNAVLPGVIETAMTTGMLAEPGVRDDLVDRTPMGRLGTPADIAEAVAFLSSEHAQWMTGATLTVDGGQSIYGQPQWLRQRRPAAHEPTWVPGLGLTGTLNHEKGND